MKWCSRSIIGYDPASQESALNIIQNAIDVFCCNVPDKGSPFCRAEHICFIFVFENAKLVGKEKLLNDSNIQYT